MFAGIKKLPPGHYLCCDPEGVRVERYWDITFLEGAWRVAVADAMDEMRWRVQEAVRLRLIADVPLGALLSGGVDSATIVALMAQASSTPVKIFTVGFDVGGWYNEFKEARLVAQRYQTEHYEIVLSAPDVPELLAKLLWRLDEPIADPAALGPSMASPCPLTCGCGERCGGSVRSGWNQRAGHLAARSGAGTLVGFPGRPPGGLLVTPVGPGGAGRVATAQWRERESELACMGSLTIFGLCSVINRVVPF